MRTNDFGFVLMQKTEHHQSEDEECDEARNTTRDNP